MAIVQGMTLKVGRLALAWNQSVRDCVDRPGSRRRESSGVDAKWQRARALHKHVPSELVIQGRML